MGNKSSSVSIFGIVLVATIFIWIAIQAAGPGTKFNALFNGGKTSSWDSQAGASGTTNYRAMARQDALDNGLNPDLFVTQIQVESGFNPDAISPAGAIGIAQIMKSTAAGWGVDPHDPVVSLSAAAKAMAEYQLRYQSMPKALAAYNAGPVALDTAISNCGANWRGCVPSETDRYIRAIWGS